MRLIRLAIILTVSLVLAPLGAEAQPAGKVYRVGFIAASSAFTSPDAFRDGLRELGYVEGQNVILEQRLAEGQGERFPELVAEMLRLKVDVLVVGSPVGALAAKSATSTIPVVFAGVGDPVGQGIVASLARPGGNITGFSLGLGDGFAGKWVELLKEAVPHVSHLAVVWNSASPVTAKIVKEVRASAKVLKVRLHLVEVRNLTQFDSAFTTIAASNARGLIVTPDPFLPDTQPGWCNSPRTGTCQRCISSATLVASGVWWPTGQALPIRTDVRPAMWTRSSEALSPPTCPCNSPRRTNW
jgi:putative ABC transport system substrate-binding protein